MSIVAAHPALAIWGILVVVVCLAAWTLLRLTDERGQHAQGRQFEASLDDWHWRPAPPAAALHHDWYAAPTITLDSPATDVGTADTRDGDPVAVAIKGDAPGPVCPPEGDEPAARPPQGTTGPGDLLARATAAIKALPLGDYLDEAGETTAYGDDAPFTNWLSQDTITRGMKAVS